MEEKELDMITQTAEEKAEEVLDAVEETAEAAEEAPKETAAKAEDAEEAEETEKDALETEVKALYDEEALKPVKKAGPGRKRRIIAIVAALLVLVTIGSLVVPLIMASRRNKQNVVMTVNGHDVMKDEFEYYLYDMIDYYSYYYGSSYFASDDAFNALKAHVTEYLQEHYVIYSWAEENGYKLTDEMIEKNKQAIESVRANYETEEDFQKALTDNHLTEDLYLRFLNSDAVIAAFSEYLSSGTGLFKVSDEELPAAIEKYGIYGAKHILILSTADDEENREKEQLILSLYDRIMAGEDFDTLMKEYTEDKDGLEANPDGYTFGPNEMVEEFYGGTAMLEIGEVSRPIESDYGWHIIKRIEPDMAIAKEKVLDQLIDEGFSKKMGEATVTLNQQLIDSMSYKDYLVLETE